MAPEFSPVHAGTLVLVGLLNVGLGALLVRIRSVRSVWPLFVFLLGISMWTIPQGLLLVTTSPTASFTFVFCIHVGASVMSAGLLHFGLAYSGRSGWLRPGRIGLVYLSIVPWAVLFFTNPTHEILLVSRSYGGELLPAIEAQRPTYWLYVFYNWSMAGLGTYLLFLEYLNVRGSDVYEKQAILIVLAPMVPFVANVLAFAGATEINYTVWGFGATGVLIASAIYQYRWLDLIPVGRDQVIEEMRDGYLVIDEGRRIVDANRSAGAFLGIPDPVGEDVGELLPEGLTLLEGDEAEQQLNVGGSHLDISVSEVTTGTGEGSVLMLRDVTDRRRAEQRFQALIENVSDVITVLDADGTITYVSPSVRTVIGYEPEDLVGTLLFDIVHPEESGDAIGLFDELLETPGGVARFEHRIRHDDGSWRVIDGVATNLLDNDIVDGIVVTSHDVTARERREQQLLQQNEYLEEFAEIVSHDLQGPLMEIRANADLALQSENADHVEFVLEATERMEQFVQDLLELARTGQRIQETDPVPLADVARLAWSRVWTTDTELDLQADGVVVVADADRLEQLLENLFRNAIQHGGTDVGVIVGETADGFFVEDDGPGVPEEARQRVFERGYTGAVDGTGLGLAIVRQIARAHGWSVRAVEAAPGGARFEFTGVTFEE